MYKLVVSGFDNVLINNEEAISTSTILEIDRVRNNGVLFAVLCDRGYKEVLEYNKDFSFVDYIISCNGACLYSTKTNEIIIDKSLDYTIVKYLINNLNEYNLFVITDTLRKDAFTIMDEKIYMIEVQCNSKKDYNKLLDIISSFKLNIKTFMKKVGKKYYLQIVSSSVSSDEVLEKIDNIDSSSLVLICSEEKDALFYEKAGYKVAVSNASSSVKKICDKTTSSNDNKGVKKILSYLFK